MNQSFYKKDRVFFVILFTISLLSLASGEIINGVILDSELNTPVKNVQVVLKNVNVSSNELGEFTLNTDEVSIINNSNFTNDKTSITFAGSSQKLNIKFPQKVIFNSIEIRNLKGTSLFKLQENRSSHVSIPLKKYAQGMHVLTIKENGKSKHYWINNIQGSNNIIRETITNQKNSHNGQKSSERSSSRGYLITFSKPGYDTLSQEFQNVSNSLEIKMDRFEFCGNDVKEADEECDGDQLPCNVINPLDYALGESACDDVCSGYNSDDCVPHPNTDVSGNSNGTNHKKALDITSLAHFNILQQVQVGMIEGNFHDIIDSVYNEHGASGVAFNHITGSGPNSIILHYEGKNRVLEDGDVLLVDIGAKYNGYCADITRTYPVNGKFSKRQREIYQLVLDAKQAAESEMKVNVHSLSQMTTFVKNFFKASPLRAKDSYGTNRTMDYFFKHGLSHYVGKHVHGTDLGFSNSEPVKAGRIFTIEPGLYIESEGFGVRLEDTYIMTNNGAENIMPNIAIEVDHVEAIMANRDLNYSPESYKKDYKETKTRSTHMEF